MIRLEKTPHREREISERNELWWKRMKNNPMKPKTYASRISAARWQFERSWTCWTKFLQHVTTHACLCTWGTDMFPFTEVSWLYQVCSPHTKAKNACCTETLVIFQVRNYCCYFTSIFVSLLGSHLLLRVPFCLKKLKHLHFGLISQDFQGVFFSPTVSVGTRHLRSRSVNNSWATSS